MLSIDTDIFHSYEYYEYIYTDAILWTDIIFRSKYIIYIFI